jgi:hypothetical protein
MTIPGFTAASSLGKSTVCCRRFDSRNSRRSSSPIEPALMISDPLRVLLLLETGGFWGGAIGGTGGTVGGIMGGEGVDTDVGVPSDLGHFDGSGDAACRKCLSSCGGSARCHMRCEDKGLC